MNERISFLDDMRAVAIIMVVGVHALGYALPLPDNQENIISFIVHTICVPVFFLVDGYILSKNKKKNQSYLEVIKKSTIRLLVPWIIFSVIYFLSRYFFEILNFLKEKMVVGHSFKEILVSIYGSVYAPQLYFLFSLFLIRLLFPIFKKIILLKWYNVVIIFFIYFLIYKIYINSFVSFLKIEGGQEPIIHAIWGIQYYFLGVILYKLSEIFDLKKICFPSIMIFFFFLFFNFSWENISLIQYLYLITFFLFFFRYHGGFPVVDFIGKNTMGIYLIHAPVVLKGVSLVLNKFMSIPLLNYLFILIVTLILSLFFVVLVKRIPYGALLFGEPRVYSHSM